MDHEITMSTDYSDATVSLNEYDRRTLSNIEDLLIEIRDLLKLHAPGYGAAPETLSPTIGTDSPRAVSEHVKGPAGNANPET